MWWQWLFGAVAVIGAMVSALAILLLYGADKWPILWKAPTTLEERRTLIDHAWRVASMAFNGHVLTPDEAREDVTQRMLEELAFGVNAYFRANRLRLVVAPEDIKYILAEYAMPPQSIADVFRQTFTSTPTPLTARKTPPTPAVESKGRDDE